MKRIIFYFILIFSLYINQISAQRVLTLDESKALALQNNSKSKNSRLEIEAARQTKRSAFTNYFPEISAGGMMFYAQKPLMELKTEGGNLPVYDGNPANLLHPTLFAYFPSSTAEMLKKAEIGYIDIIQPVFTGFRIINGNKLAALGVEVSEQQGKLANNEVNFKTEEQYLKIVSLDEKRKTIDKYEELLNRLLVQVEDAYNHGLVMKNDVLKVRLKLSEITLNKSKLENGRKLAAMSFCQHIGISYDSLLVLKDELKIEELPHSLYAENSEAITNRSEYSLLEKSVRAEQLQTSIKLGEYLPQIGIGVRGMYTKIDENEDRTLGLAFGIVSIPISDWWSGSHELEERSIKEEIAENNFKNNSELLLLQMEKAWLDLTDSYKQYLLIEESKAQAEENFKVNDDSYKNGFITVSDLLEAQAMLQQENDKLIEAKANYLLNKSIYLKVTGR